MTLALVWFVVGNTLLATTPVHQTYWKQVFWAVTIAPQGIDMSFPAATLMISNLVAKERQGMGRIAGCNRRLLLSAYRTGNCGALLRYM